VLAKAALKQGTGADALESDGGGECLHAAPAIVQAGVGLAQLLLHVVQVGRKVDEAGAGGRRGDGEEAGHAGRVWRELVAFQLAVCAQELGRA
jgi:hypothetical protein